MSCRSILVLASLLASASQARPQEESPHLLLGNPSQATKDANRDNFLMTKEYFCLSYNDSKGTPNWVSWQLSKDDLGDAPRARSFATDNHLPKEFHHVTHKDYAGSGFDRGHMCPHSDRGADEKMSHATFVMTNIVPQTASLNQKAWNSEEDYLRSLVRKHEHRRLYILAGPAGIGGGLKDAPVKTIAEGKVTVPAVCWKVAVVVDGVGERWQEDLEKINAKTRVIAVVMPNTEVGYAWAQYRVPVKEVEKLTGYRFFDRLPPDVAQALKEKADTEHVPPPRIPQRGKRTED